MTAPLPIQEALRALASPATARTLQGFFKTGPGQYGEGDVFLGIKVPVLRTFAKQHADATLDDIQRLLDSVYHEERTLALLLSMQRYARHDEKGRRVIFDLYLANTPRINNWDLVDISAPHIVGRHLQDGPRTLLHTLARSDSLWERRIAIVATFHFIRRNDFADTLHIAEMLLEDDHDLMHKAVGWMLREVGKRDQPLLESFLRRHYTRLPRTTLRYAIERFQPALRQHYLKGTFTAA
ncbi:MAG: DNA alkylation repair protein [Pseudomonadota bacterium]